MSRGFTGDALISVEIWVAVEKGSFQIWLCQLYKDKMFVKGQRQGLLHDSQVAAYFRIWS